MPTKRITIHAKPRAGKNMVVADASDPTLFIIYTTQPTDKGRANAAILRLLAEHLGIAPSRLTLASGHTSRTKLVDVSCD